MLDGGLQCCFTLWRMLDKLGANKELTDEVCDIVGHHHSPRQNETVNFKVLYDADLIANLEDNAKEKNTEKEHIEKIIGKSFMTDVGREEATKVLLS